MKNAPQWNASLSPRLVYGGGFILLEEFILFQNKELGVKRTCCTSTSGSLQ